MSSVALLRRSQRDLELYVINTAPMVIETCYTHTHTCKTPNHSPCNGVDSRLHTDPFQKAKAKEGVACGLQPPEGLGCADHWGLQRCLSGEHHHVSTHIAEELFQRSAFQAFRRRIRSEGVEQRLHAWAVSDLAQQYICFPLHLSRFCICGRSNWLWGGRHLDWLCYGGVQWRLCLLSRHLRDVLAQWSDGVQYIEEMLTDKINALIKNPDDNTAEIEDVQKEVSGLKHL